MADFIHAQENLEADDVVVVNSSHQCNVLLMDDYNFRCYRSRGRFHHYGGFYKMFPVRIGVPHSGHWNVVIDLGGGQANISYSINYFKAAA